MNSAFEARYAGNHANRLFQTINANPFIAGLATNFPGLVPAGETPCPSAQAVVPQAAGRANCNLGIVQSIGNTGYSSYNGVQLEFRANNLFRQLTMRSSYTFSKTTDNTSEIFSTFSAGNTLTFAQNPLNFLGPEHGISGIDFPHAWALSFVEDLPFFRSQHGVLGRVLGGWAFSGSYFLVSGQPYTPIQAFVNRDSGGVGSDPGFVNAFVGVDTTRPFFGNPNAPATSVGIFAGDACQVFGGPRLRHSFNDSD
jgi:hypothetical protein